MLEQAIRDRLLKRKNKESPAILCLQKTKNKESLLTCLILNRDCLQKKNTKISTVKYKSEASDNKVEKNHLIL